MQKENEVTVASDGLTHITLQREWFPTYRHIAVFRDRAGTSYLHSLWVGLTVPLFNLPVMVFDLILMPVFYGVRALITCVIVNFIAGITGRAYGYVVKDIRDDKSPASK